MRPIFTMMVGARGAGKTTVAERLGCVRTCPDEMVPNVTANLTYALRLSREAMRVTLESGADIVLDATNVERELRRHSVTIAKERGALVVGYYMATPLEQCVERHEAKQAAANRPPLLNTVTTTHAQLRKTPPTFDEKFDVIVQFGGDRPVGRCVHVFGHAVTLEAVRTLLDFYKPPFMVLQHAVDELDDESALAGFIAEHRKDYVYAIHGDVPEEAITFATEHRCTFGVLLSTATALPASA